MYDRQLRGRVEASHKGKFLVLDIETGEYEIDDHELATLERAKSKNPDTALYMLRVSSSSAYRIGGRGLVTPP